MEKPIHRGIKQGKRRGIDLSDHWRVLGLLINPKQKNNWSVQTSKGDFFSAVGIEKFLYTSSSMLLARRVSGESRKWREISVFCRQMPNGPCHTVFCAKKKVSPFSSSPPPAPLSSSFGRYLFKGKSTRKEASILLPISSWLRRQPTGNFSPQGVWQNLKKTDKQLRLPNVRFYIFKYVKYN